MEENIGDLFYFFWEGVIFFCYIYNIEVRREIINFIIKKKINFVLLKKGEENL